MPLVEATPSKLLSDIQLARMQSDRLFGILKPEALYERPIAERHRVIFYIGHLEGFDAIQIAREGVGRKSPDSELDSLFQAGIDPDSSHLPADVPADWPSLDRVRKYVERCRQRVDEALDECREDIILMALEHRQMHLETLAYMFHNFGHKLKVKCAEIRSADTSSSAEPEQEWRDIPAGDAVLGLPDDGRFGWDNEFAQVRRHVPAFRIQRHKVTNGDYLRFVEAGADMPHFWATRNGISFLPRHVRRDSVASGLACVRHPAAGRKLCALAGRSHSNGRRVSPRRLWRAVARTSQVSMG